MLAAVHWPRPSRLDRPLSVGRARTARALQALGIETVGALLEHLPGDSREARTVAALRGGGPATVAVHGRPVSRPPGPRRGRAPAWQPTGAHPTRAVRGTGFHPPPR